MKASLATLPLELKQMIIHYTIIDALDDKSLDWAHQGTRLVALAGTLGYAVFRQPLEATHRAQDAICEQVQEAFDAFEKKASHRTIARWHTAQGVMISDEGAKYDAALDEVIFNVQRRKVLKLALMVVDERIVRNSGHV